MPRLLFRFPSLPPAVFPTTQRSLIWQATTDEQAYRRTARWSYALPFNRLSAAVQAWFLTSSLFTSPRLPPPANTQAMSVEAPLVASLSALTLDGSSTTKPTGLDIPPALHETPNTSAFSPFPPASRANSTRRAASLRALEALQTTLEPGLVVAAGPEYDAGTAGAWNFDNAQIRPMCIVFPRTTDHVVAAMKAIYAAGADYGVQAGGHSGNKGWNTVQDGVMINFSHMQRASYDADCDTVTLEPGIHWGDATAELAKQGVTVVGGRVPGVGTGLLLGGGISFLSPSQGYAADNFVALDVVLVDGRLVTATADNEYADLFKALKGGANRFGIVTRYELRAVHVGTPDDKRFYGGFHIYPASAWPDILKATAKYTREVNDPNASLMVVLTSTRVPDAPPKQMALVFMFYTGSTSLPEDIYGSFLAIKSMMSDIRPHAWTDIVPRTDPPMFDASARGHVQHFGAIALRGEDEQLLNALSAFEDFSGEFVTDEHQVKSSSLWLTPITRHQLALGREKGGNVINGLGEDRREAYVLIHHSKKFEAGVTGVSEAVQRGIDRVFERCPPPENVPLFVNECDVKQEVFKTYAEYDFLKATYAKYDPERFNVTHQAGPLGL
ncbi:FAD-binding domain-containing protein [Mycena indigotica]|uniref:FAD-binding domain-containing protein n=1 Tax=Mycena indigotica TaxID=2126181 RepID=A0A8H6WEC9_9AGAR|nr:FAD-binding domain-containing protein [Mycena indigotica]KAF7311718.1 FAD-binding domain-containing protein [Mycena indigotica]